MHDPDVVAFEIRSPIRRRYSVGGGRYRPALITVWHREPGGHDSGTVCKRSRWAWHVHHWHLQIHSLQQFRRWALTRCEWCGGPSRKRDRVDCSASWDTAKVRFWRGEPGLYHGDCMTVKNAHNTCTCRDPLLSQRDYGQCAFCGRFRSWNQTPEWTQRAEQTRHAVPVGARQSTSS